MSISGLQTVSSIGKGLGRWEAIDRRDTGHLMRNVVEASDRKWRYWTTGPILDQGAKPHCVEYSAVQWSMTSPVRNKLIKPDGSIYRRAQELDEWPGTNYDGTSVRAGLKVLQERGMVDRYLWAYDAMTVANWVLEEGSVQLGVLWYRGMSVPDRHGIVHPTGRLEGGHAFLCNGVNMERGLFRCPNSWSRAWNNGGRFWILGEDLELLLDQHGEAVGAVELEVAA